MSETKDFPVEHVLSVITGKLVADEGISAIYGVLYWMTDGDLFTTRQLRHVWKDARPVLLQLYPELTVAIEEAELVSPENWQTWKATWIERYGATRAVPRLTADQHVSVNPVSELVSMVGDKPVVVVEV